MARYDVHYLYYKYSCDSDDNCQRHLQNSAQGEWIVLLENELHYHLHHCRRCHQLLDQLLVHPNRQPAVDIDEKIGVDLMVENVVQVRLNIQDHGQIEVEVI